MTCERCHRLEAVDFRYARWLCGPCLQIESEARSGAGGGRAPVGAGTTDNAPQRPRNHPGNGYTGGLDMLSHATERLRALGER